MKILYIILIINCFIYTFVRWSKGDYFYKRETKFLFQLIHYIVLIILVIIETIKFSWIHILYIFLTDTIAYMLFSFIMKKIVN